jgi:putative NIF3 family GTP cyclohydrolase 1 type 2
VALLNGSGGGSIEALAKSGRADCIVTGDVGYHDMKAAAVYGIAVIDAGHFGTERILLTYLKEDIKLLVENAGGQIPLFISEDEKNPYMIYL